MDPKASAKSKRSQTLHRRRVHNHPKPASSTKINRSDPQQQHGEDQRSRPPRPSLPSNWDRYGEGDDATQSVDDDHQEQALSVTAKPNTKGADFSYLVKQAQPRPRNLTLSSPSFDDTLPDFVQGFSPFMSSRGKSLLLSCADSDFDVDDEITSTFQVPFLTLDLYAMASQLQKLKLPQRLFINKKHLEEGLLDGSAEIICENFSGHGEIKSPKVPSNDVLKEGESTVNYGNVAQVMGEDPVAPEMAGIGNSQVSLAGGTNWVVPRSKQDDVNDRDGCGVMPSINPQRQSGLMLNGSSFYEANTAEAELNMLLDSLGEMKPPSLSTTENSGFDPVKQFGCNSLVGVGFEQSDSGIGSSSIPSFPQSGRVLGSDCSSSSSNKGYALVNQNYQSSHQATTALFHDDTIDDLLAQTAMTLIDERDSSIPDREAEKGMEAVNLSQALDDLDLLLDGF